jgi:type VI secretion system secreted protein Hcp
MDIDTHIKIADVPGESQHEGNKDEIEVISWNWGVSNAATISGGGSGRGKAVGGNFTFLHRYDKASPVLAKKCIGGDHFDEVVLTARKSGAGQKDFLVVKMKEVFITGVQPSSGGDGSIMENVALSYGEIGFEYKPQDAKGTLGGPVSFNWNAKSTKLS